MPSRPPGPSTPDPKRPGSPPAAAKGAGKPAGKPVAARTALPPAPAAKALSGKPQPGLGRAPKAGPGKPVAAPKAAPLAKPAVQGATPAGKPAPAPRGATPPKAVTAPKAVAASKPGTQAKPSTQAKPGTPAKQAAPAATAAPAKAAQTGKPGAKAAPAEPAAPARPRKFPKGGPAKADLKRLRARLEAMLTGNRRSSEDLEREALQSGGQDVSVDHMADHGTDSFEQDFTLGLLEGKTEMAREIQDAIDKIDGKGELPYGVCEACADRPPERWARGCETCPWIPAARLQVVPHARLCIRRQEEAEGDR